jgi:ectoine hydroxylase-related dioxygenase (phytanoyl-CoA dioxygenase family)
VTCWITLDDTAPEAGTLEYVPGSHRWTVQPLPEAFHAEEDYRGQMRAVAAASGIDPPEPVKIVVPAGSCVFHAGEIWHGSAANETDDRMRRAIGIHMLPEEAVFSDRPGGYIYRRYQKTGDPTLDESFFPLLWSEGGRRTGWIEGYCRSGKRLAA